MIRGWKSATVPLALLLSACGGGSGGEEEGLPKDPTGGPVPDTGQTACYYASDPDYTWETTIWEYEECIAPGEGWTPNGQDGAYSINPMSYTDNGDGTVYDNVTGRTWQKCSLGESGSDCSVGEIGMYTWSEAMTACANLGDGWRLPTVLELVYIIDYGSTGNAIDTTYFPGTGQFYWSSTPVAGYSGRER